MNPAPASLALALLSLSGSVLCAGPSSAYAGRPYQDVVHPGAPQRIPGPVFCAYYDTGGEGVAYHDTEAQNQGSGKLNPADGSYLNEFRRNEGVDISYTKQIPDLESTCNKVVPPLGLLFVGWTEPGEWFKLTVEAPEAATYVSDVLYTSQRGGTIEIEIAGASPRSAFDLASTFDAAETIPWRQWHHLLCNGDVLDTPEEHTVKAEVLKYYPRLFDGQWHEVVIPMADLNQIKGFNPKIISEIHLGLTTDQETDGSFFIDDISFDDRGV